MKKVISLIVAVMMIMALIATPAFAANQQTDPIGSITINGVSATSVYEIYKLLDLESYDTTVGAYSYKVNSAWSAFFATAEALNYVAIDDAGYVTWKAAENDDTYAAFAQLALSYAQANGINPVKSSEVAGDFAVTGTSGVFANLELGYYLVDSSVGALCGLTTTNPAASINAKNGIPTIDKQVQEDSVATAPGNETGLGSNNTADIGQLVYYHLTINVHPGSENYMVHDKMTAGLTFNPDSIKVEHIIPDVKREVVNPSNYTLTHGDALTTDCKHPVTGDAQTCTFHLDFSDDFIATLQPNDKIIVTYNAMLNRNAIVATEGNKNDAFLQYGDEQFTTSDSVTTYTYGIDIIKTDSQNSLIDGAQFKIYDALTGGNEVKVVLLSQDADGSNKVYRRARSDEPGEPIIVTGGKVRIVGLDNGTYYLEETVAPDGYNKLTARQRFIISDGNLDATFNGEIYSTGSGVQVVNKTGSMLPETGGIGTTLFVTLGGLSVLAAGVVLFAKKRMSQIAE